MRNIAIIPARSKSKGLIDKNIKLLNGIPLLVYTIQAAVKSNKFNLIYVSTDSSEYAEIAEKHGAIANPLRDDKLATDFAGSIDVILNTLENFNDFDNFVLLQPTSPLRTSSNISEAFDIFERNNANNVVSLVASDKSPNLINKINADGTIHNFVSINQEKYNRQSESFYEPNGAIFISRIESFIKEKNFYDKKSYPYIMNKIESIDIDDIYDFEFAEMIIKKGVEKWNY